MRSQEGALVSWVLGAELQEFSMQRVDCEIWKKPTPKIDTLKEPHLIY